MGYSFDKERNKYTVRETINGKRHYIGRYDTEAEARAVDLANSPSALESYKVSFEHVDSSFDWVTSFRKWKAQRKADKEARRREKQNVERVANLIDKM